MTERATELVDLLRAAISNFEEIINPADTFDPATTTCTFKLTAADCMEAFFWPRLIAGIQELAPKPKLRLRSVDADFDYATALETGETDAVIGNWPGPPGNVQTVHLMEDQMVCLFRQGHVLPIPGS